MRTYQSETFFDDVRGLCLAATFGRHAHPLLNLTRSFASLSLPVAVPYAYTYVQRVPARLYQSEHTRSLS